MAKPGAYSYFRMHHNLERRRDFKRGAIGAPADKGRQQTFSSRTAYPRQVRASARSYWSANLLRAVRDAARAPLRRSNEKGRLP
jgi:hypothetical protein